MLDIITNTSSVTALKAELEAYGLGSASRVQILTDNRRVSDLPGDGLDTQHDCIVMWRGGRFHVTSYRMPGYARTWSVDPA